MANAAMNRSSKDDKVNLYTTPTWATEALILSGELDHSHHFWEPCCGMGHISNAIIDAVENYWKEGKLLSSTDLYDHGYEFGTPDINFLEYSDDEVDCIITNPPFDRAGTHFAMLKHALSMPSVKKVAFFMPVQFLETPDRAQWLEESHYFSKMYSFADRVKCLTQGDESLSGNNTAKHFAWFIFDKDHDGTPATIHFLYKPESLRKRKRK